MYCEICSVNIGDMISNLCNIVTAFGTLGAVIVSLYLSSKDNKCKPKLEIIMPKTLKVEKDNKYRVYLKVTINNTGNRNIYVSSMYANNKEYNISSKLYKVESYCDHEYLEKHFYGFFINIGETKIITLEFENEAVYNRYKVIKLIFVDSYDNKYYSKQLPEIEYVEAVNKIIIVNEGEVCQLAEEINKKDDNDLK